MRSTGADNCGSREGKQTDFDAPPRLFQDKASYYATIVIHVFTVVLPLSFFLLLCNPASAAYSRIMKGQEGCEKLSRNNVVIVRETLPMHPLKSGDM